MPFACLLRARPSPPRRFACRTPTPRHALPRYVTRVTARYTLWRLRCRHLRRRCCAAHAMVRDIRSLSHALLMLLLKVMRARRLATRRYIGAMRAPDEEMIRDLIEREAREAGAKIHRDTTTAHDDSPVRRPRPLASLHAQVVSARLKMSVLHSAHGEGTPCHNTATNAACRRQNGVTSCNSAFCRCRAAVVAAIRRRQTAKWPYHGAAVVLQAAIHGGQAVGESGRYVYGR